MYFDNVILIFIVTLNERLCLRLHSRICNKLDDIDKYPYVVSLELLQTSDHTNIIEKHNHLCTASALSPTWALTAAHCLISVYEFSAGLPYNVEKLVINYGSSDLIWINNTFSSVLFTVTHPAYRRFIENNNHNAVEQNDIALLRTTPMDLSNYLSLSVAGIYLLGYDAVLAGFRITNETYDNIIHSDTSADNTELKRSLQILNVTITECVVKHRWTPTFCLSSKCSEKVSTCGGDSGSPIVHSSGVVAILSVGESTGDCLDSVEELHLNMAEVVVPISPYYTWISSFVID